MSLYQINLYIKYQSIYGKIRNQQIKEIFKTKWRSRRLTEQKEK